MPCAGEIVRARLPNASKHVAHLLIDRGNPSLGREAATVVSDNMIVTFAHSPHDKWEVGQEKTVRWCLSLVAQQLGLRVSAGLYLLAWAAFPRKQCTFA